MIWPVPALLAWGLAWMVFLTLRSAGVEPIWAVLATAAIGGMFAAVAALRGASRWRQLFIVLGFPLSLVASGAASGLPAWLWLAPLGLLLALYPLRSWQDAPLFPTPRGALLGLARTTGLPSTARLMDAGCGLGDGLLALRAEFPQAQILGLEWSRLLTPLCRLRCAANGASAEVRRADIWSTSWADQDLVYLFQRPESMPRAVEKAGVELHAGAWLVSLEFEAAGWLPTAKLESVKGKPVWIYQLPLRPATAA